MAYILVVPLLLSTAGVIHKEATRKSKTA